MEFVKNAVKIIKRIVLSTCLIFSLGFTSCITIPYESKTKVEQKLEALKVEQATKIAEEVSKISDQKEIVIFAQENQMQTAANSLYGANLAFDYYIDPTRLDIIINNRVNEATSAIGLKPTYEAIVAQTERLRNELDETKTSMEQLRRNHAQALEENKLIAEEKLKQQALVVELKKNLHDVEREYIKKINDTQDELNAINNQIIALEKRRADEQASRERLLRNLMIACGALAVICLLGALYSPVEKKTLGLLAMILGGVTIAIPFIQSWMIVTASGIILAVIIAKILYNLNISKKANSNLINAIHDVREAEPEAYEKTLKPSLREWNTRYVTKSNGVIEKENDVDIEKHINKILTENNRL